jgi:hypothetical protein
MSAAVCGLAGAALIPLLAACTTSPPDAGTGGAAPSDAGTGGAGRSAGAGSAPDAAFDWHALVLLPFGASLRDSPRALHEVLLFHEAAQGPAGASAAPDNPECYSVDGAPPRFIDDRPQEYMLCFMHDRLNRIEARVGLPAAAAGETFARACAIWQGSVRPAADSDGLCTGTEGGIAFSARLDHAPGEPPASLSITLSPAAADEFP